MAYAFTLLAALGLFLWATPARTAIADRLSRANIFTQEIASSSDGALGVRATHAFEALRKKTIELLHEQLDGTIINALLK